MQRLPMILAIVLIFLAGGAVAEARSVYLNGVKLDASVTLQPQTFVGCDVRIDPSGDIHITAKGYKVAVPQAVPDTGSTTVAPATTASGPRGFWLVTKQTQRGVVQYDVDVFINDAHVKKVRSVDDPAVLDVSRYVKPGDNRVRMIAVKNAGERRASMSPTETMEIFLGEGTVGGGTVTVDKVHVSFKRSAADVQNVRQDYGFKAAGVH
jgi:hypothetical protein